MKPNKSEHTPGPWRIETENEIGTPTISIRDGLNQQIATVNPYRLTWRDGDAHLIAAAPDMLEALENCLNYFNYAEEREAFEYAKEVRKLIAKAKGGAE